MCQNIKYFRYSGTWQTCSLQFYPLNILFFKNSIVPMLPLYASTIVGDPQVGFSENCRFLMHSLDKPRERHTKE